MQGLATATIMAIVATSALAVSIDEDNAGNGRLSACDTDRGEYHLEKMALWCLLPMLFPLSSLSPRTGRGHQQ